MRFMVEPAIQSLKELKTLQKDTETHIGKRVSKIGTMHCDLSQGKLFVQLFKNVSNNAGFSLPFL